MELGTWVSCSAELSSNFPVYTSRTCVLPAEPQAFEPETPCAVREGTAGWRRGGLRASALQSKDLPRAPGPPGILGSCQCLLRGRPGTGFSSSVNVASYLRKAGLSLNLPNRNAGVFICIRKGLVCFFK